MVTDETRATCEAFVGRERRVRDSMGPEGAVKLATILGRPLPDHVPPAWHWAYFNEAVAPEDVGHDGHERLGLFLPAAPFDRRMWAAGEIVWHRPLVFGTPAQRRSVIEDVAFKEGKSGPLCFVTVKHEITQGGTLAIREAQTIVYRDRGLAETALRRPEDPVPLGYHVFPDTQLVAYSAITQNGHRIHWDRDFCREAEGYPGLVVHGPLLATTLADVLIGPAPCRFTYRATAPVFETTPVRIVTDATGEGRIERSDGMTAMAGRADPISPDA